MEYFETPVIYYSSLLVFCVLRAVVCIWFPQQVYFAASLDTEEF